MIQRKVSGDPALHFLQGRPADGHRLAAATELHLSARPFEVHDEPTGDLHRNITTQILFDER
jgi:hypothetical protein